LGKRIFICISARRAYLAAANHPMMLQSRALLSYYYLYATA
jgi:hypothetical protein